MRGTLITITVVGVAGTAFALRLTAGCLVPALPAACVAGWWAFTAGTVGLTRLDLARVAPDTQTVVDYLARVDGDGHRDERRRARLALWALVVAGGLLPGVACLAHLASLDS